MTTERRNGKPITSFSKWVYENPRLDSNLFGLANMDVDWIWHQWRTPKDKIGKRETNQIILIEEKPYSSSLSFPQKDTMYILHQMLISCHGKKFRTLRGDKVTIFCWGFFKLEYTGPELCEAKDIHWNRQKISLETLEKILRFEIHPVSLNPWTPRRHHNLKMSLPFKR